VQDILGPFLAYLDIVRLAASEGCFLIGGVAVVVDVGIVEYEAIAEIHERHTRGNVAEIAGAEKVATFDSVVRIHRSCLD